MNRALTCMGRQSRACLQFHVFILFADAWSTFRRAGFRLGRGVREGFQKLMAGSKVYVYELWLMEGLGDLRQAF